MSITLPATFVDRVRELSPGAVKAYLCLWWMKDIEHYRYPSQNAVAEQMRASQKSVMNYLRELERAGYIEKKRVGSGRRLDYVLLSKPAYES